jgi:AraC-like DNA-binding protein
VEHLIGLGLLDGRPNIDWLCRRLQIPRRSLQRDLGSRGTSFEAILRRVLIARASELLRRGVSATQTGFELGYTDSAHFSRAFRRWTGQTPHDWQAGV